MRRMKVWNIDEMGATNAAQDMKTLILSHHTKYSQTIVHNPPPTPGLRRPPLYMGTVGGDRQFNGLITGEKTGDNR